jgi:hypothetical protein
MFFLKPFSEEEFTPFEPMTIKQEKATQVDPGGHSFVINERLKYVYQKRARFCLGNLDVREKQSAA